MPSRTWMFVALLSITVVVGAAVLKAAGPSLGPPPPTAPGPSPVGPPRALLVVHGEWRAGATAAELAGARCPEGALVHGETEVLRMLLARAGFALYVAELGELVPAEVADYDLVVHHNGGWGSALDPIEVASLTAARAAGHPILFLGDDAAVQAQAAPELLREMGVVEVKGNGRTAVSLHRPKDAHPFPYGKDPDEVRLAPTAQVRLADDLDNPVAWIAGPVAVAGVSLRSSDVCPVSDEYGSVELQAVVTELVTAITRR